MQISVESTGALERRMEVSVPREQIDAAVDERLKHVSRTARLKGFRPGKAPIKVIRQQFGAQVRQEVLSELMQSSFAQAITEHKLSPTAGPRIEPISIAPGEDLKYRAIFEVFPEVTLVQVEGLAVTRPVAEVTESDIEAMLQNLREQRPQFEPVERESRTGDRVTMDFTGQIDGKPFEGSKGDDVAVILGAGRMLKDFEAGVTGARPGEHRSIAVRYPDDYHNKSLAGQTANFEVEVKKVDEKHLPPLDDAFCREYGVSEGGMEQLLTEVADNMRRELRDNVRARLKQQLLERFFEANPLEVPKSLIDAQVREMQIDTARRIGAKDASQVPPPEPFVEPARRRVGLGLLINELIKARGITLDRARVEERLAEMAASYPDPDSIVKAYRQNADALRQLENTVLEDQVVDYLLERATVVEQPSTFRELMNFGA
ncbi:MAG TPA: trigger factor [Steroidobacteraceae bacterium]|nr:trigger factor [Steroidobacteraceae bacterium]